MLKVNSAVIIMMKAHCTPECGMGRNPEGKDSVVLGEPNPPHSGVFLYVRLFVLAKVEYRNTTKPEMIKSEFKSLPVRKVSNSHTNICLVGRSSSCTVHLRRKWSSPEWQAMEQGAVGTPGLQPPKPRSSQKHSG